MAVTIDRVAPVAHLPLVLGVLRKLDIAEIVNSMIPPHSEQIVSAGRAVEALVLAILDGHHALYKVGQRLGERGMLPLLQPGLAPHSLHDTRLGQTLDALFDANLHESMEMPGLCRYRDVFDLKIHVWIPALEDAGQFPVEHPHSRL